MAAKKPKPSAKKAKPAKPKTSDPAQSAKFVQMAKELEADESGASFQRAVGVLIPKKK